MSAAAKAKANPLATPVGFSKGVLGHAPWSKQAEILDSIAKNRRTAVKSCHSSGKTFLAADAVLWWITTFKEGIAITTAPGWLQVEKLLWGEIRRSLQTSRVQYPKPNLTELKLGEGNYAIGISTKESTRFQGFKGKHVLIVLDEAPGVSAEIWGAIQGLRAGGKVHLLAIGNPTIIGGEFYDAFTIKRDLWQTFTINAFDTPNLLDCHLEFINDRGQKTVVGNGPKDLLKLSEDELDWASHPYLCARRWVKEMFQEWGPNHAYFQSRVLGDFPSQSDDTLLPLAWLEQLKIKTQEEATPAKKRAGKTIRAGLDVAGPGEAETVLTIIDEDQVLETKAWPQPDPRGEVVAALQPYQKRLECVNVDSIGVGWGIYLHLKDQFGGDCIKPVNVGHAARESKKYVNAKAEYYWGLRMRAKDGELLGITDEKTIGQLTSIRYSHNAKGQIVIESKDEMVKRGIKSPDRAESVMLAYANARPVVSFDAIPKIRVVEGDVGDPDLVRPSAWRL